MVEVALFFQFLSLDIHVNIVRHSRKEVVNDIEKTFKIDCENDKNDTPEGSWTSVLGPRGGWTCLLGRFGSHVAPQSAPG